MKQLLLAVAVVFSLSLTTGAAQTKIPETYNFKRGLAAYTDDNFDDAIRHFSKETEEHPKNGYAYFYLAASRLQHDADRGAEILTACNKALKFIPKKDARYVALAYNLHGVIQAHLGDTLAAYRDYTRSAELNKEDVTPLNNRAALYYVQKQPDKARADFEEAVRRDPASARARTGLGQLAFDRRDYAEAVRQLDRALKLDPSVTDVYSLRALCYMQQRKYREAVADVVSGLGESKGNLGLVRVLYQLADSAFIHVETQLRAKTVEDNTNDTWTFWLASLYEYKGLYPKAITTYRRYIDADPAANASANYRVAFCYRNLYDYNAALAAINTAIAADSTDADYYSLRAIIYDGIDLRQAALDDMNKAIGLDPEDAANYVLRSRLHRYAGDKAAALTDVNTALTLDENNGLALVERGRYYRDEGKADAARADYEKVLRTEPDSARSQASLYAYVALGRTDRALALNDSLIRHSKAFERDGYLYNGACVNALLNRPDSALVFLERSLKAGYADFVNLGRDEDLQSLRTLPAYRQLVATYRARHDKALQHDVASEATMPADFKRVTTEIPFTRDSGIYKVKCTINGLPLHFYFDTGAADVTISSVEAAFMLKNGYLTGNDLGGKAYYGNASGTVTAGTVVNLRHVDFGGLTLANVKASVVDNQDAPLLLGQSVLSRLGKLEIDYERNVIKITHVVKK